MLGTLDGLLSKAEGDCRGNALMQARLAQDMHPLATQIRFVRDMPGEGMERLAGLDFTPREDDPVTVKDARERIANTLGDIETWAERTFAADDDAIELALSNGMTFDLTAAEYVRDWALPQYYFHVATAYAILRKEGIDIGKADYVPHMFRYVRGAA